MATHPKKVMAAALFFVILCSLGLINFKWVFCTRKLAVNYLCPILKNSKNAHSSEADANRLLYPQDSDFVKNKVVHWFAKVKLK